MNEKKIPEKILEAFDISEKKTVAEICRIAGISRVTYYNQISANTDLKLKVLEKERANIDRRIAAIT